jgi:hypothetical protein
MSMPIKGYKIFFVELLMKTFLSVFAFLVLAQAFWACGGGKAQSALGQSAQTAQQAGADLAVTGESADLSALSQNSLDELASLERAGSWIQGMALMESGLRENAGDYSGAVAAAYKELAWAYGKGMIQKEDVEKGLLNVLALKDDAPVMTAANAVLAFSRGQWDTAASALAPLFDEFEEPDGFGRWMILVCALEKNPENRQAGEAYKAIRARYAQFPEYWYRGVRAFSGAVSAEYAENCINSSPQGPFAEESRKELAVYAGLKKEDGLSIKTKREIEAIITNSFSTKNPQILSALFPLISLPDNPYTIFAVGALRALAQVPLFRDFFNEQAASSKGRLGERLSYICRG